MTTPTIDDVIRACAECGTTELLIAVADYFYCLGAGIIPPPVQAGRAELFATLEQLHQIDVLEPRERAEQQLLADELPGWLLSLPNQDTQPLEGWGAEGWPI